jgi:FMN phosphatase YigB (HAD superfamily)
MRNSFPQDGAQRYTFERAARVSQHTRQMKIAEGAEQIELEGKPKLVILDLDCFLYPYDKTFRNAVLRAWLEVRKEYGLPILRRKIAQRLIAEAKEGANENPDDALCRCISELAGRLEGKGFSDGSVIGMLEIYYRGRKMARWMEIQDLDPPYKEMIAMAYDLRLFHDRKSGKKAKLTSEELQRKILEGEKGITRLWNGHMGTGFLHRDAGLVSQIQRLTDAGVEVAVLTHSFKHGKGEAMEKLQKLGLRGVIREQNVFGIEEISPYRKGAEPEAYEKVLAAINGRRAAADSIKPGETIMAEDTLANLVGAKKAGMQTVWVPRREKGVPRRPSVLVRRKLALVDHIYATPHEFLEAVGAGMRVPEKLYKEYQ